MGEMRQHSQMRSRISRGRVSRVDGVLASVGAMDVMFDQSLGRQATASITDLLLVSPVQNLRSVDIILDTHTWYAVCRILLSPVVVPKSALLHTFCSTECHRS